jgi:maltose O-acetyltransferase
MTIAVTPGDSAFWLWQSLLGGIPFDWARNCRYRVYRRYFKTCGQNVLIHNDVLIKYPSMVSLGSNITINKGCIIGGSGELIIGDYTQIGAGTKILSTTHNHDRTDIPIALQGLTAIDVKIGRDVWFGFDCIVLPGAMVGESSVVAAGAVLTAGTYPPFSILAGNPARVVRDRRQRKTTN